VKMNSPPQSAQVNKRSTNSIAASPGMRDRLDSSWNSRRRLPEQSSCRSGGT
jgi:hypothetical protein